MLQYAQRGLPFYNSDGEKVTFNDLIKKSITKKSIEETHNAWIKALASCCDDIVKDLPPRNEHHLLPFFKDPNDENKAVSILVQLWFDVDEAQTFISDQEKHFMEKKEKNEKKPAYLDEDHPYFSTTLKLAVDAWMLCLQIKKNISERKNHRKKQLEDWVRKNRPAGYDLTDNTEKAIGMVANPNINKRGGAPKTGEETLKLPPIESSSLNPDQDFRIF